MTSRITTVTPLYLNFPYKQNPTVKRDEWIVTTFDAWIIDKML